MRAAITEVEKILNERKMIKSLDLLFLYGHEFKAFVEVGDGLRFNEWHFTKDAVYVNGVRNSFIRLGYRLLIAKRAPELNGKNYKATLLTDYRLLNKFITN